MLPFSSPRSTFLDREQYAHPRFILMCATTQYTGGLQALEKPRAALLTCQLCPVPLTFY